MKSWILLNSKSTTYIFVESKYLTNVKTVPTTLKLMNNGISFPTNQLVRFRKYGNVWYHPKAMGNILRLGNIKKKNLIIYDS